MIGKISLDFVDLFGNGIQPVIRVNTESESSDPRDKLLKVLFEDGSGRLRNLRIFWDNNNVNLRQPNSKIFLYRADRELAGEGEMEQERTDLAQHINDFCMKHKCTLSFPMHERGVISVEIVK